MKETVRFTGLLLLLVLTMVASGCAGTVKNMREVPPAEAVYAPDAGKAMVVFMRPSGLGFAVQSSVFEIKEELPSLVGIVAAKKKVTYQAQPGERLFMVVGEAADFMSANLQAGRTYYVLVTPRPGAWKARFSLRPAEASELDSSRLDDWLTSCEWVEKTAGSDAWANNNMSSIRDKQVKYYQKWLSKDPAERPRLMPEDGR